MKAIIYTEYGPPDVLALRELDKPTPKDNEVLLKVHAVEATKTDCELRSFHLAVKWFWLPLRLAMGLRKPRRQILGMYFSGEVVATGKNVSEFAEGDQVFGATGLRMGAYGEYMCLPETSPIVLKPKDMSFEEAATIPLGGLNALHYLRRAKIRMGEKVLVNGAGGSIGSFAVQLAKAMGAKVTAVDSSIKEDMLRQLGADHFLDYRKEDFTKIGQTYDVIFSMVAQTPYAKCIQALNPKGRYLMANPRMSDMLKAGFTSRSTDKTVIFAFAGETKEELETLKKMIEKGELSPIVDRIYPIAQAAEAHRRVETEQRLGPVVLSFG